MSKIQQSTSNYQAKKPSATTQAGLAAGVVRANPTNQQTETKATTPADKVELSKEAKTEEKKPYSGISTETSDVKADPWKKGKNDSLEGILRNQGYSLKEIYSKDKNGKTLIDAVQAENKLKNPNLIHPGQDLKVPRVPNSSSQSSMDLKPGEKQSQEVSNDDKGITNTSTMTKNADGTVTSTTSVNNSNNRDANTSTTVNTPNGGRVDQSDRVTQDGTQSNTTAQDNKGGVTTVQTNATSEGSNTEITNTDKKKDMQVSTDGNQVTTKNGEVTTSTDISEKSKDGFFERTGKGIAEVFGYKDELTPCTTGSGNAEKVNVKDNGNGSSTVTETVNGKEKELVTTAGDNDDTLIERAGEKVDNFFSAVGSYFKKNPDSVLA